ncbi:GGDEF domain-containing protein [Marinospirillum celere]|nr:GGDEF domain-containing protein [Marinospirillum celere]
MDHFLGDLRRALKAQERYFLNVIFKLQFPDLEGGLDPGFSIEASSGFQEWLSDVYLEEVDSSPFYRRLLVQQEQIRKMTEELLIKASEQQLDSADFATFLRAVQRFNELGDQLRVQITSSLIELDELTGLYNRNVMERDIEDELESSRRSGRSFSVAMLDLDHFKAVNDTHGHAFGDKILQQLADNMEASVRPYDRIYRYGGEEFLVLLQDTPLKAAVGVLERLRKTIASKPMGDDELMIDVTVSVGVMGSEELNSVEALIEAADEALYSAKEKGRNRVEVGPVG